MYRAYLRDKKAGREGDPTKLCTERHTGTSASAPMAAGLCALALEAKYEHSIHPVYDNIYSYPIIITKFIYRNHFCLFCDSVQT